MCAEQPCRWPVWWAAFASASLTGFAVLETAGYRSACPRGTATSNLRAVLGVKPARPWRLIGSAGLLGAMAAAGLHILGDWP